MRGASAASVARANSSGTVAEVRGAFRLSDNMDVETACLSAGLSCALQPKRRKNGSARLRLNVAAFSAFWVSDAGHEACSEERAQA